MYVVFTFFLCNHQLADLLLLLGLCRQTLILLVQHLGPESCT